MRLQDSEDAGTPRWLWEERISTELRWLTTQRKFVWAAVQLAPLMHRRFSIIFLALGNSFPRSENIVQILTDAAATLNRDTKMSQGSSCVEITYRNWNKNSHFLLHIFCLNLQQYIYILCMCVYFYNLRDLHLLKCKDLLSTKVVSRTPKEWKGSMLVWASGTSAHSGMV